MPTYLETIWNLCSASWHQLVWEKIAAICSSLLSKPAKIWQPQSMTNRLVDISIETWSHCCTNRTTWLEKAASMEWCGKYYPFWWPIEDFYGQSFEVCHSAWTFLFQRLATSIEFIWVFYLLPSSVDKDSDWPMVIVFVSTQSQQMNGLIDKHSLWVFFSSKDPSIYHTVLELSPTLWVFTRSILEWPDVFKY